MTSEHPLLDRALNAMARVDGEDGSQRTQTAYRLGLAEFWGIQPGWRVLEIGCGQGDTTAVLAARVGPSGHVTACDPAVGDYGAPFTLSEATEHIQCSDLGGAVTFHLDTDVAAGDMDFAADAFDAVVISHASWYFRDGTVLDALIDRVRPWTRTLCFAEWDLAVTDPRQLPHFLAALLWAQFAAFRPERAANIHTLTTKGCVKACLAQRGFTVARETVFDTAALRDGHWEVTGLLAEVGEEMTDPVFPGKYREVLQAQLSLLRDVDPSRVVSLNSFGLVATRGEMGGSPQTTR